MADAVSEPFHGKTAAIDSSRCSQSGMERVLVTATLFLLSEEVKMLT